MKFVVDANLPFKLAIRLRKLGFDVIHTDNLPKYFETMIKLLEIYDLIEINNDEIIAHEK